MPELPKRKPNTEDVRKLHAEVNQIMNQRFLITTSALTFSGVFYSFMTPKDLTQHSEKLGLMLLWAVLFLHVVQGALLAWHMSLGYLQKTISNYLIATSASEWEQDWMRYPDKERFYIGTIQWRFFVVAAR